MAKLHIITRRLLKDENPYDKWDQIHAPMETTHNTNVQDFCIENFTKHSYEIEAVLNSLTDEIKNLAEDGSYNLIKSWGIADDLDLTEYEKYQLNKNGIVTVPATKLYLKD